MAFEMLSEVGEFDDPLVCYHRSRGMEVSGYLLDEDEGRLDVFLSIHTNAAPPETVIRQRVDVAFRRLGTFTEWCLSGGFVELEESSPVFRHGLAHPQLSRRSDPHRTPRGHGRTDYG